MLVYRVEHSVTGHGPYHTDIDEINELLNPHDWDTRQYPSPYDDSMMRFPRDGEVCGFSSLEQLHKWFSPDELDVLNEYGYIITQYDVPDDKVTTGSRQVLFYKD